MDENRNNKHDLKALTDEDVINAYKFQRENSDWTLYNERAFVENLLQTRFNFLITVYALFLVPFFGAKDPASKIVLFFLGLIIVGIMGLAVYRAYVKFDIIMKMLYKLGDNHVLPLQKRETQKRKVALFNVNPFIGYVIPIVLFLSIIIMGILLFVFKLDLK